MGIGFYRFCYIHYSYLLIAYLHRDIPMMIYRYAYMPLCHDGGMLLCIDITIYVYTDISTILCSSVLVSNCLDLIRQGVTIFLYLSFILIPTFNPRFFMDSSIRSSSRLFTLQSYGGADRYQGSGQAAIGLKLSRKPSTNHRFGLSRKLSTQFLGLLSYCTTIF